MDKEAQDKLSVGSTALQEERRLLFERQTKGHLPQLTYRCTFSKLLIGSVDNTVDREIFTSLILRVRNFRHTHAHTLIIHHRKISARLILHTPNPECLTCHLCCRRHVASEVLTWSNEGRDEEQKKLLARGKPGYNNIATVLGH